MYIITTSQILADKQKQNFLCKVVVQCGTANNYLLLLHNVKQHNVNVT
jgi:hypothetical protein